MGNAAPLFAQPLSSQFDEYVLKGRAFQMDVGKPDALLIDPLHEFNDRTCRMRAVDRKRGSFVVPMQLVSANGFGRRGVVKRPLNDNLDTRLAERTLLNLARRADGNDAALIDNGNAVAQAFSHAFGAVTRVEHHDARATIQDLFDFAARHESLCRHVVSSTVHQHDGPDVAGNEPVGRQVMPQGREIKFFQADLRHGASPQAG